VGSTATRARCPRCKETIPIPAPDDAAVDSEREEGVTERPPVSARRAKEAAAEPAPAPRKQGRLAREEVSSEEENGHEEDIAPISARRAAPLPANEDEDEPEPTEDRPRKKKKKKKGAKKGHRRIDDDDEERPAWPWWAFGGGGVALTMLVLLCITLFASFGSPVKWYALYLLIALPVGTVIFFVAMFISSVALGAIEIGEIHVALFKAFLLVLLVSLTSLLPFGRYLTWLVWLVGLLTIFQLDLWEARMVFAINWLLNVALNFALISILYSAAHSRTVHDVDLDPPDRRPGVVQDIDD
jgi:hypothetical protein